jgi:hypothetical protein
MSTTTYDDGGRRAASTIVETETETTRRTREPSIERISWQGIIAGVVVAAAVQILLSLLGAGVGLGLVDPAAGDTPGASSFGIGAGVWWTASNLVALFAGGYVAAWLAGITLRFDGMLHGLVTWGITLLLTVYLLGSAIGSVVGGAGSLLGSAASAGGEGLKSAASAAGVSPDMLQEQARSYLQPTGQDPASMSAEDAQKAIAAAMPGLAAGGERQAQSRERIVAIMAAQLKVSHDEAAKRFDDAQARLTQAKDQAKQTAVVAADRTAGATSKGSFLAFAALLLGAIAAAFGGSLATQRAGFRRTERSARVAA